MGNKGFIRATKFTGSVACLLKQGQPGFFYFILSAEYQDPNYLVIVSEEGIITPITGAGKLPYLVQGRQKGHRGQTNVR